MIQVKFKPSELTSAADRKEFARWLRRARKATRAVIAQAEAGKEITFNDAIWSELKTFLLERYFWGKCAYCESPVTATDFGDAEHYRPKRGVTNKDRQPVYYGGAPHPGYYWLAYDWRNLLPACGQCNSGDGKMNQFPIEAGRSHVTSHKEARSPAAIDARENPLLLHPYYHDPSKYLRFGDDGTIAAAPGEVEAMAAASITTYNLKRGSLDGPRHTYQTVAWHEVLKAINDETPVSQALAKYEKGLEPYSAACLQFVKLKFDKCKLEFRS